MGIEIPEEENLTPMQRFNKRWGELEKQYPTSNQENVIIFGMMKRIAEGEDLDECIKTLPEDNTKLIELLKELALAFKGEEKKD